MPLPPIGAPGWWAQGAGVAAPPTQPLPPQPRFPRRYPSAAVVDACRARLFDRCSKVVLGGGAMYGIMYIGALLELCNYDRAAYAAWLARLTDVAGTSAGALIGFLIAAGVDPWVMRDLVHRCNLGRIVHGLLDLEPEDIARQWALSSGRQMDNALQEVVAAVTGRVDITMRELYARHKRSFTVVACNDTRGVTEYWTHVNQPDLPVWRALRCSASVPGLFPGCALNGDTLYDGGVTCNLPCHLFPPEQTLTLLVHSDFTRDSTAATSSFGSFVHRQFLLYSSAAQLGPMRACPQVAMNAVPCAVQARTDTGKLGQFCFNASPKLIDDLIADGATCARSVLARDLAIVAGTWLLLAAGTGRMPATQMMTVTTFTTASILPTPTPSAVSP